MGEGDTKSEADARITAVRHFNRFYTRHVGALNEGLLQSTFSLVEMRVLYELGSRSRPTAGEIARHLGHDPAYLSRILKNFRDRGLVETAPAPEDARRNLLSLTPQGRETFRRFDRASSDEVAAVLKDIAESDQRRLLEAMAAIEAILTKQPPKSEAFLLRPHRPGDLGWVVHRHSLLYSQEYGWDETFEAMVAEVAAQFIRGFDPRRERSWIAEREGAIVGSVFLVQADEEQAKLRLLFVEPEARGLGIGRRLVEECIETARALGYRKLTLWTNDVLVAARRLYETTGFELVAEEPHHSFGKDLVGETWEREL